MYETFFAHPFHSMKNIMCELPVIIVKFGQTIELCLRRLAFLQKHLKDAHTKVVKCRRLAMHMTRESFSLDISMIDMSLTSTADWVQQHFCLDWGCHP